MKYVIVARVKPGTPRWYWGWVDVEQPVQWTRNKGDAISFDVYLHQTSDDVRSVRVRLEDTYGERFCTFGIEPVDSDIEIVRADFLAGYDHTSVDLPAALRFAQVVIGFRTPVIQYLEVLSDDFRTHGSTLHNWAIRCDYDLIALAKQAAAIDRRRMRALQALVREGFLEASWQGGGEGSVNNFGVGRFRCYHRKEQS